MAGDSVTYEYPPVYKDSHLVVRDHRNEDDNDERVAVYVGMEPMTTTPTIVGARRLRDALDEYIDDEADTDDTDTSLTVEGDDSEVVVSDDSQLTVEVNADVSAASEAIEELQSDVDALTADINAVAKRLNKLGFGDVDYGLPAPGPSAVQRERGDTESREMVPVEPLYDMVETIHTLPGVHSDEYEEGYQRGQIDASAWFEDELDKLTDE